MTKQGDAEQLLRVLDAPLETRGELARLAFVLDGLASVLSASWRVEDGSLDELLARLKVPDSAGDARELVHFARVASYEGESDDEDDTAWAIDDRKLKQADEARARLADALRRSDLLKREAT